MNEPLMIRNAVKEDVAQMAILMTQLGYPTIEKDMRIRLDRINEHPDYCTLVALAGNEIVGLAGMQKGLYYEYNAEYLRLLVFVVKQSCRKQGIGGQLLKACEQYASTNALNAIVLTSSNRAEREAAHAFYQKNGFFLRSSGFYKQL
jgi:GNAT superfamily N-acetyltransferase